MLYSLLDYYRTIPPLVAIEQLFDGKYPTDSQFRKESSKLLMRKRRERTNRRQQTGG